MPRKTIARLEERIRDLEEDIELLREDRDQLANEHYQALRKLEQYRNYVERLEAQQ